MDDKGLAKYHKNTTLSPYYGVVSSPTEVLFMLRVKLKSAEEYAFPYACLNSIRFNPSMGIEMVFTEHRIKVTGTKLNKLFEKLILHQVTHVNEGDSPFEIKDDKQLFVKEIEVLRF